MKPVVITPTPSMVKVAVWRDYFAVGGPVNKYDVLYQSGYCEEYSMPFWSGAKVMLKDYEVGQLLGGN
jgi:hypothetical protein